jgi:hypothetical protein
MHSRLTIHQPGRKRGRMAQDQVYQQNRDTAKRQNEGISFNH